MIKQVWFSTYDNIGNQAGCTIIATSEEEGVRKFDELYFGEQNIADYGSSDISEEEEQEIIDDYNNGFIDDDDITIQAKEYLGL